MNNGTSRAIIRWTRITKRCNYHDHRWALMMSHRQLHCQPLLSIIIHPGPLLTILNQLINHHYSLTIHLRIIILLMIRVIRKSSSTPICCAPRGPSCDCARLWGVRSSPGRPKHSQGAQLAAKAMGPAKHMYRQVTQTEFQRFNVYFSW